MLLIKTNGVTFFKDTLSFIVKIENDGQRLSYNLLTRSAIISCDQKSNRFKCLRMIDNEGVNPIAQNQSVDYRNFATLSRSEVSEPIFFVCKFKWDDKLTSQSDSETYYFKTSPAQSFRPKIEQGLSEIDRSEKSKVDSALIGLKFFN